MPQRSAPFVALIVVFGCTSETPPASGEGSLDARAQSQDTDAVQGPTIVRAVPESASFRGGDEVRLEGDWTAAVLEVRFGDGGAALQNQEDGAVVVLTPPALHGGLVPVEVTFAGFGKVEFDGFRYLGVPPPALRFVEVPEAADPAPGSHVLALRSPGEPRVAVLGPQGVHLLAPSGARLTPIATQPEPLIAISALCAGDFDGDGDDDVFVSAAETFGVFLHSDAGLVWPAAASSTVVVTHAACGEWDVEPGVDIIAVRASPDGPGVLEVWLGDGTGGLQPAAGGATVPGEVTGLDAADVDGDGATDVLVGRAGAPPRLWLGDAFGGFATAPTGSLPAGGEGARPLLADFTGDGAVDAALLGPEGARLWVNDGAGRLADHSGLAVGAPSVAGLLTAQAVDLDLDGAPDILALTTGGGVLLRNDGAGRLFDYSPALLQRVGQAPLTRVAALDLDSDGDPDLVGLRPGQAAPVVLRGWDPLPFDDPDLDGVPSSLDGCPLDPDPDQTNTDHLHFACADAAACEAATGCQLKVADTGRAYLVCADAALGYEAARALCASRGASLLWLDDPAEEALVVGYGPGRFWIDLSDVVEEGVFVSADQAPPPYTNWEGIQPDDSGQGEDCVELNASQPDAPWWNDLPCDHPIGVVCEDAPIEAALDPPDACDVCPLVVDADQADTDDDGIGDACAPPSPGSPEE